MFSHVPMSKTLDNEKHTGRPSSPSIYHHRMSVSSYGEGYLLEGAVEGELLLKDEEGLTSSDYISLNELREFNLVSR